MIEHISIEVGVDELIDSYGPQLATEKPKPIVTNDLGTMATASTVEPIYIVVHGFGI